MSFENRTEEFTYYPENPDNETELEYTGWLNRISDIGPGKSAILSGNKFAFYTIHGTAISVLFISLIASVAVIVSVYRESKKAGKWDFSDRFPFYLAIADGLWAMTNLFGDQLILLTHQKYPEKAIATCLGINVAFFFGYQQLMNAGLSIYTYLKVVRRFSLDLGYLEWKLHFTVISILLINCAIFFPFDSYGSGGYWFLNDFNTTGGIILAITVSLLCTLHATSTLVAYRAIRQVIDFQRQKIIHRFDAVGPLKEEQESIPNSKSDANLESNNTNRHYHSTATNCLTTFIYISICLYFPFAVAGWAVTIQSFFGVIEPFTIWTIAFLANSGGWVNAWGYAHNRKIKNARRNAIRNRTTAIPTTSTGSNYE